MFFGPSFCNFHGQYCSPVTHFLQKTLLWASCTANSHFPIWKWDQLSFSNGIFLFASNLSCLAASGLLKLLPNSLDCMMHLCFPQGREKAAVIHEEGWWCSVWLTQGYDVMTTLSFVMLGFFLTWSEHIVSLIALHVFVEFLLCNSFDYCVLPERSKSWIPFTTYIESPDCSR